MIMVIARDHVCGDAALGQDGRDAGRQPDGGKAGVNAERDPRPAQARSDQGHRLGFPDDREGVADRTRFGRRLEGILRLVQPRLQPGDETLEIGFAAQPCSLLSRFAAIRRRSAFSRMKPAASRWS